MDPFPAFVPEPSPSHVVCLDHVDLKRYRWYDLKPAMPQSEEAAAWSAAVCQAVQQIPYGKVTSYGHIALLIGRPDCPRQVGTVMKHLPDPSSGNMLHSGNVPWQRVINAKGEISPRGPGGARAQADALQAEGVTVDQGGLGQFMVSFRDYGWFPDELSDE